MTKRDPHTIYLANAKEAHGEPISAIKLRKPEGKDIRECGYPLRISDGGAEPLAGPISKYISRLGGVPQHVADSLSADEWNQGMGIVLGFFGEETKAPNT